MLRLVSTRIISANRIKSSDCLSYLSRRFLQNSVSKLTEDNVIATVSNEISEGSGQTTYVFVRKPLFMTKLHVYF